MFFRDLSIIMELLFYVFRYGVCERNILDSRKIVQAFLQEQVDQYSSNVPWYGVNRLTNGWAVQYNFEIISQNVRIAVAMPLQWKPPFSC